MRTPLGDIERGEPRIPERKSGPWGALAYRDFRLLWLGGLLTNLGYWMQFTSLTYLIGILLAHSAAQSSMNLGILGAVRSLPVLLLAPIAGYVADRYPRRRTLSFANAVLAALAFTLAFIAQAQGAWVLPAVLAIAGLFSGGQCFDFPTRQSWVTLVVPRPLISNAIGLASIANNVPVMFGPALSGILISSVGIYPSFFLAAAAQCTVVIALLFIRPAPISKPSGEPMFQQIAGGVRFIASHAVLRWLIFMLAVSCLCLRPYNFLLAAFAGHVLNVDATSYGLMLAAGGVGTVFGALTTALNRSERRGRIWFFSSMTLATALVMLAFARNFTEVLVLLTIMGWGAMTFASSTNVLIQSISPTEMRGRAMSLYTLIMSGFVPGGTLIFGALGAATSLPLAYLVGGAAGAIATLWVWLSRPAVRQA